MQKVEGSSPFIRSSEKPCIARGFFVSGAWLKDGVQHDDPPRRGRTAGVRTARDDGVVPRISEFYGIAIYVYFSDHAPPHIHAQYSGIEAVIAISDGPVIRGSISDRALFGSCENGWSCAARRSKPTGYAPPRERRLPRSTPLP